MRPTHRVQFRKNSMTAHFRLTWVEFVAWGPRYLVRLTASRVEPADRLFDGVPDRFSSRDQEWTLGDGGFVIPAIQKASYAAVLLQKKDSGRMVPGQESAIKREIELVGH